MLLATATLSSSLGSLAGSEAQLGGASAQAAAPAAAASQWAGSQGAGTPQRSGQALPPGSATMYLPANGDGAAAVIGAARETLLTKMREVRPAAR